MKRQSIEERIIVDPDVMVGKPIIKGTRIPVDAILQRLAEGMTIEDILSEYPAISRKDVIAALEYASAIVRGESIIPHTRET